MFALVGQHLPKGVFSLSESIKALQAYAEKSAPLPASALPLVENGGEA